MPKGVVQVGGEPVADVKEAMAVLKRFRRYGLSETRITAEGAAVPMHVQLDRSDSWLEDFCEKVFRTFG